MVVSVYQLVNTFHATQMAVWQRGPKADVPVDLCSIGKDKTLKSRIGEDMNTIHKINMPNTKPEPSFHDVNFQFDNVFLPNAEEHFKARNKDSVWLISRSADDEHQTIPSWSGFNRESSTVTAEITTAGLLPFILQPAHEYDTLNTVIMRCQDISKALGQTYTVITVDQALYCKMKELTWLKQVEFRNIIVRLGGFHISTNFLQCIGKHIESAGLEDTWIEAGIYGENTAQTILSGKAYNRAIRAHKLSYEALWRVYWKGMKVWMAENGRSLDPDVREIVEEITGAFSSKDRQEIMQKVNHVSSVFTSAKLFDDFDDANSESKTFVFWRHYMKMVEILLDFVRAERDGNWSLHLSSFSQMLPFFALYDHTNYARWGPVYLTDMSLLHETAPEVFQEFAAGNFPVKRSSDVFNQVSADQALEWLNRSCKVAGGLIGITQNETARDRWALTYNEKAYIAECTRSMFGMCDDEVNAPTRNDTLPSGIARDEEDVTKLVVFFEQFKVFNSGEDLRCISTNDIAPSDIAEDLLQAKDRGHEMLKKFVEERLISKSIGFNISLPRNKSKTFASLSDVVVQQSIDKKKLVKADRNLFHRLLIATDAGRKVDLSQILQHELSPVPLALAEPGGNIRSTTKSVLSDILKEKLEIKNELPGHEMHCLIFDGAAVIQKIGKPSNCRSFGDLADVFWKYVCSNFTAKCKRIDVVFDRYRDVSIKQQTRTKRSGKLKRPIRKLIDNRDVPLPQNWKNFVSLAENKENLAQFLSMQLSEQAKTLEEDRELIVAGGFSNEDEVFSSQDRDLITMESNHEEADTRMVLHAVDAKMQGFERTVIQCADTDVLVMLVFFINMLSNEVWLRDAGRYIPVHDITLNETVRSNLLTFHAMTGCDTTSSFSGHGKKSTWKVFVQEPNLLDADDLNDETMHRWETFICRLYGYAGNQINQARLSIFLKAKKSAESLPPTQDALYLHFKRVYYQVSVWKQAMLPFQVLDDPVNTAAWKLDDDRKQLCPVLITKEPVPISCMELISCGCKTKCSTGNCRCYRKNMICTGACVCEAEHCNNPVV